MRRYLADFHDTKDIFLEFRAHKKAKAQATKIGSLVRTEITTLDGPSRQQAITAAEIRGEAKAAEIDALRENSDFNFPKMHFVEHLPEHISGYGHLGQYSTEISERAHKKQIKEGWRKSNHVDAMVQILKYGDNYRSMMKMKMEIGLGITKPKREKWYPRFCGSKVKKYRDVAALSEQIEVPQLQALLAGYLNLDEDDVRHCRIRVWKSLEIEVELMPWQEYQVETIQRIRCTVKEAWRKNRPSRNDPVWIKQLRGISDNHYRALHGRKPAFVEALFQVELHRGDTRKRNLALVDMLNPVDSGYVDPDEGLPWVEIPLTGAKYEIVEINQIGGAAQLVPLNPAGSQNGERYLRRWVVNSRIDLNSFGWIYYDEDQQQDDMARRRR
jgi:hypothetical protein